MALTLDAQVAQALHKMVTQMGVAARPPVGDWATRRQRVAAMFAGVREQLPPPLDVSTCDFSTVSRDGTPVLLRWFSKRASAAGPAVVYVHGGGLVGGSVDIYDSVIKRLVSASGVPFLAVDYRLAPEHRGPAAAEDCYAALQWLAANAQSLQVDARRIAIMGDSAGGAHAAAAALLARDRNGPALARQILIYPMLDDQNRTPLPALLPFATWNWDDNQTAWDALLGDRAKLAGAPEALERSVAFRARDLSQLPSTYIEVGQLDIFCAESVAYAQRLIQAQVATELHVLPGVPHGFELFAPEADVSRRAMQSRLSALASF